MKMVQGKIVTNVIRKTEDGRYVVELEDGYIGIGLPDHNLVTNNADKIEFALKSAKEDDDFEFETTVEGMAIGCSIVWEEDTPQDNTRLCMRDDSNGNWQPLFSEGFM